MVNERGEFLRKRIIIKILKAEERSHFSHGWLDTFRHCILGGNDETLMLALVDGAAADSGSARARIEACLHH
jgi:hypothetical protein